VDVAGRCVARNREFKAMLDTPRHLWTRGSALQNRRAPVRFMPTAVTAPCARSCRAVYLLGSRRLGRMFVPEHSRSILEESTANAAPEVLEELL
jgi:hypothetical protein